MSSSLLTWSFGVYHLLLTLTVVYGEGRNGGLVLPLPGLLPHVEDESGEDDHHWVRMGVLHLHVPHVGGETCRHMTFALNRGRRYSVLFVFISILRVAIICKPVFYCKQMPHAERGHIGKISLTLSFFNRCNSLTCLYPC